MRERFCHNGPLPSCQTRTAGRGLATDASELPCTKIKDDYDDAMRVTVGWHPYSLRSDDKFSEMHLWLYRSLVWMTDVQQIG